MLETGLANILINLLQAYQQELVIELVIYVTPTVFGADTDLVHVYNARIIISCLIFTLNAWPNT